MANSTALFGPNVFNSSPQPRNVRRVYGAPESPRIGRQSTDSVGATLNCNTSIFSCQKKRHSAGFNQSSSERSLDCTSPRNLFISKFYLHYGLVWVSVCDYWLSRFLEQVSFSSPMAHAPGLFASSPMLGTNVGQQSLDNSWSSALNRLTPPRPYWNISPSSTTPVGGLGNSGTSSMLSMQYQVSPVPQGDRSVSSLTTNLSAPEFGLIRHSASEMRLSERDALEVSFLYRVCKLLFLLSPCSSN